MPLTLKMLNRDEFVPENKQEYALFVVDRFYGSVEFKYMSVEFMYAMIDAETGHHVPSSVCYNGQDEIPFNVPVRFNDDNTVRVLDKEELDRYKNHKKPEQRFWHVKTWFLTDNRNGQINPEELDEVSLGIMKVSDLEAEIVKANLECQASVNKSRGE